MCKNRDLLHCPEDNLPRVWQACHSDSGWVKGDPLETRGSAVCVTLINYLALFERLHLQRIHLRLVELTQEVVLVTNSTIPTHVAID